MVHWFAAVTCRNWEHNQYPVIQGLDTITLLYVTNLGHDNSVTKPFASLHETGFFLQLQQIWEWCTNVELVERAAALRNLKLLVGSGCLEFQKGMAGMDSWNKHVVTCCEHLQPKGSQTRFQPTEAKNSISAILDWLAAVASIRQPRSQWISSNPKIGYHNSIFCKHFATIMQSWPSVLPLSGTSSFW